MTRPKEELLLNKVKAGDTQAFAQLVAKHKDLVFTLACRMLGNREDAEELAQDVFIKVFHAVDTFKGESKLATWIYRIAYNRCLDQLKKAKKERILVRMDAYTENTLELVDSAMDQLEAKERHQLVRNCIQLLPPEDAAVLTLYYLKELSLDELSAIVGVATGTVKVRLHRSRKKLAVLLRQQLEPETVQAYGKAQ